MRHLTETTVDDLREGDVIIHAEHRGAVWLVTGMSHPDPAAAEQVRVEFTHSADHMVLGIDETVEVWREE